MTPRLLFFVSDPGNDKVKVGAGDPKTSWQFWLPSPTRIVPPGTPPSPFVIWWVLYMLRCFRPGGYCVVLCFEGRTLVHRSCVFPKFYRFPFMGRQDLQVGDVWTAPEKRGKGLARRALTMLMARFPQHRIWYIADESNPASVAVAEKAGLRLHGLGTRTRRWGFKLLGQFRVLSVTQ